MFKAVSSQLVSKMAGEKHGEIQREIKSQCLTEQLIDRPTWLSTESRALNLFTKKQAKDTACVWAGAVHWWKKLTRQMGGSSTAKIP